MIAMLLTRTTHPDQQYILTVCEREHRSTGKLAWVVKAHEPYVNAGNQEASAEQCDGSEPWSQMQVINYSKNINGQFYVEAWAPCHKHFLKYMCPMDFSHAMKCNKLCWKRLVRYGQTSFES